MPGVAAKVFPGELEPVDLAELRNPRVTRKRFLHPSIWSDPAVATMTPRERLLFIGFITIADDVGRLLATPAHLHGQVFPTDPTVTSGQVKKWRDAIVDKNPNVQLYASGGIEYIALRRWEKYQKPSHATPTNFPAPPFPTR